ncbi:hypothetical protein M0R45_024741 [Rubus argutus]|uniref:Uncharacterized protein n=1 Tax=Rubus argutus TaxID=59490 RepID=A0AAW1WRY3_RUBAR
MSYGSKGMGLAEYGPYWRHVRKLCTQHLLCPSKVEAFAPLRGEEIGLLVQAVKKAGEEGQVVDLSEKTYALNEDITYRVVLGCKRADMFDLKGIIKETVLALSGIPFS